jgi:hypothetical protein
MSAKKSPTKQARGTLLHLDNARLHLAPEAFENHGIIRLPHPLDSPDLSPADFWRFGYITATLEEFFFQDINEARDRRVANLRSIPLGTFIQVFDEWKERLAECISRDGEYLSPSKPRNAEACLGKKVIQATDLSAPPVFLFRPHRRQHFHGCDFIPYSVQDLSCCWY